MSAPSRRPEIRRRRTRKEKIVQLRKRLTDAKTDADRSGNHEREKPLVAAQRVEVSRPRDTPCGFVLVPLPRRWCFPVKWSDRRLNGGRW